MGELDTLTVPAAVPRGGQSTAARAAAIARLLALRSHVDARPPCNVGLRRFRFAVFVSRYSINQTMISARDSSPTVKSIKPFSTAKRSAALRFVASVVR